MDTMPVSTVIVNYNRAQMLLDCVSSVLGQNTAPAEVIVVDNASSDGSAEAVDEKFGERVRLIRLDENLGFAGGNNVGIRAAVSDWVALINNDAVADPDWLCRMVRAADMDSDTGLVACRILRADRHQLIDNVGVGLWPDGMSRGAHHLFKDAEVQAPDVFIPSGCAVLLRKQAFEEAGGFDESFFCYSEDTDLFVKIRLLGYKCVLADSAVVYHSGGTLGTISPDKVFFVERNRIRVLVRYYPLHLILISPLYTAIRYAGLVASIARHRRSAESLGVSKRGSENGFRSVSALLRAYGDAFSKLLADLAVRSEWREKSKVPAGTMSKWIRQYRLDWKSLNILEAP